MDAIIRMGRLYHNNCATVKRELHRTEPNTVKAKQVRVNAGMAEWVDDRMGEWSNDRMRDGVRSVEKIGSMYRDFSSTDFTDCTESGWTCLG